VQQWLHQCSVRLPAAVSPPAEFQNSNGSFFIEQRVTSVPTVHHTQPDATHQLQERESSLLLNSGVLRGSLRGELSDGFSQTMSDVDNLSTPRHRDDAAVSVHVKLTQRSANNCFHSRARQIGSADVSSEDAGDNHVNQPPVVNSGDHDTISAQDPEAFTAIGRLRHVKRDENVPHQFRRYNIVWPP
jgi:hypothetical protein